MWALPASGDAIEVLSWRHGAVRVLRILPNPSSSLYEEKPDLFSDKRPLMVLCDTATPGPQYYSLSFISLKTGAQVYLTYLLSHHKLQRNMSRTYLLLYVRSILDGPPNYGINLTRNDLNQKESYNY